MLLCYRQVMQLGFLVCYLHHRPPGRRSLQGSARPDRDNDPLLQQQRQQLTYCGERTVCNPMPLPPCNSLELTRNNSMDDVMHETSCSDTNVIRCPLHWCLVEFSRLKCIVQQLTTCLQIICKMRPKYGLIRLIHSTWPWYHMCLIPLCAAACWWAYGDQELRWSLDPLSLPNSAKLPLLATGLTSDILTVDIGQHPTVSYVSIVLWNN